MTKRGHLDNRTDARERSRVAQPLYHVSHLLQSERSRCDPDLQVPDTGQLQCWCYGDPVAVAYTQGGGLSQYTAMIQGKGALKLQLLRQGEALLLVADKLDSRQSGSRPSAVQRFQYKRYWYTTLQQLPLRGYATTIQPQQRYPIQSQSPTVVRVFSSRRIVRRLTFGRRPSTE